MLTLQRLLPGAPEALRNWRPWMDAFLAAMADRVTMITQAERTTLPAVRLPTGITAAKANALLDRVCLWIMFAHLHFSIRRCKLGDEPAECGKKRDSLVIRHSFHAPAQGCGRSR